MIIALCLACPGDAADTDVTLQWDISIDDAYLKAYKFYYYSIPGVRQSLGVGAGYNPYALSYTKYIKDINNNEVPVQVDISLSDPKYIELSKYTIDGVIKKSHTKITLHFTDNNIKEYYFAVASVDERDIEGPPTTPEVFPPLRRLTVRKQDVGRGTVVSLMPGINSAINCGIGDDGNTPCMADFAATKKVTLVATEDTGNTFVDWPSGCDSVDSKKRCNVTMGEEKTVKARFIPTPRGDINKDTFVNVADAILILQAMSGMDTLPYTDSYFADANSDGKLGLADAIYILQKAAGLREE